MKPHDMPPGGFVETLAGKIMAWGERNGCATRKERAAKLGISFRTLQGWEQGQHLPRGLAMKALLNVIEKGE